MDKLRGTCGPNDLHKAIHKLLRLADKPREDVAKVNWQVSYSRCKAILRTARCAAVADVNTPVIHANLHL
jgi:hypothetical protein